MVPIACFGVVGALVALAAMASIFASSRKIPIGFGLSAMIIGLMALGMGLFGTMQGRRVTEQAVISAPPEYAEMLRTQGYEESDNNLVLGGLASVLPLLVGMLAIGRGVTMKEATKP